MKSDPDHRENDPCGANGGLDGCHARDLLREIYGLDGRVQHQESTIPTFRTRSLGIYIHGRSSRLLRDNGEARGLCRRARTLIEISGRFVVIRSYEQCRLMSRIELENPAARVSGEWSCENVNPLVLRG